MERSNQISSYMFRLRESLVPLGVAINGIGWESTISPYSYSGLNRDDPGGTYLFQYTIAGLGMIRIKDRLFRLEPGTAFLVPFESDYRYYKPDDSDYYECLFISLDGKEAALCWETATEQFGPVLELSEKSQLIRCLDHIYQEAKAKNITDIYKSSMLAYQFLMEMYRHCKGYTAPAVWPQLITDAVRLMDDRYRHISHLDDLAGRLGVSKFHLIKLFHRTTGKTPIQYLTQKRMEEAVKLLRTTDRSLEEIAQRVGYMHVNYFSKVFRKCFGVSPGQMRKKYDAYEFLFD